MELRRSLPGSAGLALQPVLGLLVLVPCIALVIFALLASAGVANGPALLAAWLGANLLAMAACLSSILADDAPMRRFGR